MTSASKNLDEPDWRFESWMNRRQALFVCGSSIGFWRSAYGQNAKPEGMPAARNNTREPIPLDQAPDDVKSLLDEGKVEAVYDSDPKFVSAGRGWADFVLRIDYTFQFRRKTSRSGKREQLKITVTKFDLEIDLTHLVRLPSSYKSPLVWNLPLMRHELDHVAISLDPRPLMLLRHLCQNWSVLSRSLAPQEVVSDDLVNQLIKGEVEKRHQAVIELIRQHNIDLDTITTHGSRAVPQRAQFFADLYSKEELAKKKFPFIDQVQPLLVKLAYQDAKPRALSLSTADRA